MKKVNKEFEELMFNRTEGRMIEQLTVGHNNDYYCTSPALLTYLFQVRDYSLGTSLPVIQSAAVVRVERDTPDDIQEIDVMMDIEYTGNCEFAIDADLVSKQVQHWSLLDS